MPWTTPVAVILIVGALRGVSGSSLAEAAFYEGLRRAFVPRAERTITLADHPELRATVTLPSVTELPITAGPVAPAAANREGASTSGSAAPAPPPEPPTENDWRARMTDARAALERDQLLLEAMQGRVNSLNTEFVNRDDPAQRAQLAELRQRALDEVTRLTKQVASDREAIAAIEDDARKKGIPPGWIR